MVKDEVGEDTDEGTDDEYDPYDDARPVSIVLPCLDVGTKDSVD